MEEISKVKDSIESRLYSNSYAQLQSRTWLIHWSLFPLFNHEPSRDIITDLYFSAPFINTIQTLCPWILRYLTAAVVTNRGRSKLSNLYQKQLKDLIRIVKQEGYEYSDPLTDFIRALYVEFDFEEAQKNLSDAEALLREDYFLHSHADNFVEAARHLISESYCKIHQRIDIKYVATSKITQSVCAQLTRPGICLQDLACPNLKAKSGLSILFVTHVSMPRLTTRPEPSK